MGDKSAVPALLAASAKPGDRVLEHSLIYALIEIDNPQATAAGLHANSPRELRAALIALDQMDHGELSAGTVTPLLESLDPLLRQTATWIAGHHPEWGGALAGFFRTKLLMSNQPSAAQEDLERQLVRFTASPDIQALVGSLLNDGAAPDGTRELLLHVIAGSDLNAPPSTWSQAVANCLAAANDTLLGSAVAAARVLGRVKENPPNFSPALHQLAVDPSRSPGLRLAALAAMPEGLAQVEPGLFSFLCENVEPSQPVAMRADAVSVLARANLTEEQLVALADTVRSAGPLEMTRLLAAFGRSTNEAVGLKLLGALKEAKSLSSLRPDLLQELAARYPRSVQDKSQALLASLQVDTARQRAHLEALLASLGKGDVRRGQAVFNSQKAACSSCHAMGYLGGHVGPDLTTIGQVRTERDLLESIVYPSASFVRSYEPYIVKTKSDDDYSGILRKDAPDEIVLVTGPTTEVRVARAEIADMRPGMVSVMPAGLEQQLSRQDLADLVAFLKATKWGAN